MRSDSPDARIWGRLRAAVRRRAGDAGKRSRRLCASSRYLVGTARRKTRRFPVPVFRDSGEPRLDLTDASCFGRSGRPFSADAMRAHARFLASTRVRDLTLRFSTAGNPEKA